MHVNFTCDFLIDLLCKCGGMGIKSTLHKWTSEGILRVLYQWYEVYVNEKDVWYESVAWSTTKIYDMNVLHELWLITPWGNLLSIRSIKNSTDTWHQ